MKEIFSSLMRSMRSGLVKIFAFYFKIVPRPKSFSIPPDKAASTVIVTESNSFIIEALLLSFAKRSGFKGAINLEDLAAEKTPDKLAWISLHAEKRIAALLEEEPSLSFVTLNIFSSRGPFKNNPHYRLSFWDLAGILALGRFLIIFLGTPLDRVKHKNRGVQGLLRSLRVDLYKNLKLVRGTPFQPIEIQERIVVGGNDFSSELNALSQAINVPVETLKRRARASFYDIAANPRRPMYRIIAFVSRIITSRLFSSVQTNGLETLKEAVRESTVIIVPMHRSHLDYILVGSKLYESDLNPPLVAAGINLSFWPFGFIIRSVGGYFVKRNVRHDRLHALILKRYVYYLAKRGHMQEFFIEGGRSRSGRMRQPKIGLLNVFVDAFQKGHRRDISFVPVSITYENVIEDSSYGTENTGRSKQKESLFALIRAGSIFNKSYGDVVINFGAPISLASFLRGPHEPERRHAPVGRLALQISRNIRDQTNPSLNSLALTALLMAPHYGLPESDLSRSIHGLGKLTAIATRVNPLIGKPTPALDAFLSGRMGTLGDLAKSSTIQMKECLGERAYFIPGEKRFTADFYKNATMHIFLPAALFAVSELLTGSISLDKITALYPILEHDFILPAHDKFLEECSGTLKCFIEEGLVTEKDSKRVFISRDKGIFIPALLYPFFQSLFWVIKNIDGQSEYNTLVNKLQGEFRTAVYLGLVSSTEASSAPAIIGAIETLTHLGILSISEKTGKAKEIRLNREKLSDADIVLEVNQALTKFQNSLA